MDRNIATKKEKLYQDPDDYTLKDSIMTDESKVGLFPSLSPSDLENPVQKRNLVLFFFLSFLNANSFLHIPTVASNHCQRECSGRHCPWSFLEGVPGEMCTL